MHHKARLRKKRRAERRRPKWPPARVLAREYAASIYPKLFAPYVLPDCRRRVFRMSRKKRKAYFKPGGYRAFRDALLEKMRCGLDDLN